MSSSSSKPHLNFGTHATISWGYILLSLCCAVLFLMVIGLYLALINEQDKNQALKSEVLDNISRIEKVQNKLEQQWPIP